MVDFGTFNLLRAAFGMPPTAAQAISFSAALISNFAWNRYWTYPDSRSKPVGRQASQFLLVSVVGLSIRTVLFVLVRPAMITLGETLGSNKIGPTQAALIGENMALVVAVIVVLFWNFGVNRLWTYSDVQKS